MLHALVMAVTLLPVADDKPDDKGLSGDWKVVKLVANGQTAPAAQLRGSTVTFKDGKLLMKQGGASQEQAYETDPSQSPKTIDLTVTTRSASGPGAATRRGSPQPPPPEEKQEKLPGIYKLEGNRLTLCVAIPPNVRPTEFPAEPAMGVLFMVLEKVEKKK
jgi:uncharacterized protein (TIGR03067 family)